MHWSEQTPSSNNTRGDLHMDITRWSTPKSDWLYSLQAKMEKLYTVSKEYNQSDFCIDHLVMSMCRVFSCVVGKGCLLWPVRALGKTLLAFALLHSTVQGQICLLLQVSLDFLLLHSSPLWWKGYRFGVLVLKGLVRLHKTIQYYGNPSLCPNQ